jgi:hypothetical protein
MSRRPDWRQVALRRAHERVMVKRHKWRQAEMSRFQMTVGPRYTTLLADAAAHRGLSTTSYIRRAVAAFIAHDLGMEFTEVVADTPHVQGPSHGKWDDGTGYGQWRVADYADDKGGS